MEWSGLDPENLVRALCKLMGLLVAQMPDGEIVQRPGFFRTSSSLPYSLLNGVIDFRQTRKQTAGLIEETLQYFSERQAPWRWIVQECSRPMDLARKLERAGLVEIFRANTMVFRELEKFQPDGEPKLDIRLATDPKTLEDWWIPMEVFGMPSGLVEALRGLPPSVMRPLQRYVGYEDGAPVCCGSLFTGSWAAAVHFVGTLPTARGRGCGSAMTNYLLNQAKEGGFWKAVLTSSDMAYPMYLRIGFEKIAEAVYFAPPNN